MLSYIVEFTNKRYNENLTVDELYSFIALLLLFGVTDKRTC